MVRSGRKHDGVGVIPLMMIPGLRESNMVTDFLFVPRTDTGVPR